MTRLTKSLAAWGTPEFAAVLKAEVQGLGGDALPLQQGLSSSSYALDSRVQAMILRVEELAPISHHPSTADADPPAVAGRTPSSRLDVVSATPSPSSGPCAPSQRRLDALATNGGEKCGLAGTIRVKAGIFYTGIIAGCNCADDPTPVEENAEYCEVRLEIDRATAETTIALWEE